MPRAGGARGKRPTGVTNRFRACIARFRSSRAFLSSRRSRRPYVGYPHQFPRKKVSVWHLHHKVCPNTIFCFAQHKAPARGRGSRNAQDSSATSLAALCGTTAATGPLFGRWAVLPGLGTSQTTHGRYDSEHARAMPAPVSAPPRYLWDLWQANVAPRTTKGPPGSTYGSPQPRFHAEASPDAALRLA